MSGVIERDPFYRGARRVPPELSHEELFRLLSNGRRLVLLSVLSTADERLLAFDDIVDGVCTEEAEGAASPPAHRRTVRAALYHKHLPALEAAGVVDFDTRVGAVVYWGHPLLDEWVQRAAEERCDA